MKLYTKQPFIIFPAFLLSVASAATVQAHHSLAAQFDTTTRFELRGTITKVEWTNPHIWVYLDVTDENGAVSEWECELGSPNHLFRQGVRKEDLPVGTVVSAQVVPAREDPRICSTRSLTRDDGTVIRQ